MWAVMIMLQISTFSQLNLLYSYLNLCQIHLQVYYQQHAVKPSHHGVRCVPGQKQMVQKDTLDTETGGCTSILRPILQQDTEITIIILND